MVVDQNPLKEFRHDSEELVTKSTWYHCAVYCFSIWTSLHGHYW